MVCPLSQPQQLVAHTFGLSTWTHTNSKFVTLYLGGNRTFETNKCVVGHQTNLKHLDNLLLWGVHMKLPILHLFSTLTVIYNCSQIDL